MKTKTNILCSYIRGLRTRLHWAFTRRAQAVVPGAPDGGYPGGNTAEGQNALFSLTSGGFNTAVGFFSLRSNATGQFNTAIGAGALLASTADENTGTGAGALLSNTTGAGNTANGAFALFSNTIGNDNTATGSDSLVSQHHRRREYSQQELMRSATTPPAPSTQLWVPDALFDNTTGDREYSHGVSARFLPIVPALPIQPSA